MVAHPGDHVGIGVERDRHGGVAQEFMDIRGVDVANEQQRRAGVTQVVDAYPRKPGSFWQRRELPSAQVRGIDEGTRLRGEDEAVVAVEVAQSLNGAGRDEPGAVGREQLALGHAAAFCLRTGDSGGVRLLHQRIVTSVGSPGV